MLTIATAGPSALWYLTRGSGATALLLVTISLALGIANVRRATLTGVPRFVLEFVHKNVALLAVAFLCVHILTAVLDPFAPIRIVDALIPFISAYRPLWLGLGALAFDLLLAVIVTSLLRHRLGFRGWRATHWFAYACWPIAVVHGLGTGSDARHGWLLAVVAISVLAVLVAIAVRVRTGWPERRGIRVAAMALATLLPIALLIWLPSGPLASNWSARAGTPVALLHGVSASATTAAGSGTTASTSGAGPASPGTTFTAQARGTVTQGAINDSQSEVHIDLRIAGQHLSYLSIRLYGQSINGGGLNMTSSRVALGTAADPELYPGQVTALSGTTIAASVAGAGTRLKLVAQLHIDAAGTHASGQVSVTPG